MATYAPQAAYDPVAILNLIMRDKIKIDPDQQAQSKRIVNNFLDVLVPQLKAIDPLFRSLFQRIHFTGSSYENLCISFADEYDINLVLKLPFNERERKIEYLSAFARYKFINRSAISAGHADILIELFDNNYLMTNRMRNWMQSLIDRVLPTLRVPNVRSITHSSSGPARTVILATYYGYCIDIDLVPVFEFRGVPFPYLDEIWFLVPKGFSGKTNTGSSDDSLWRMHFPEAEDRVLYDRGCAKSVIKVMKLLRDAQGWNALASYYLKTVVMWEIRTYNGISDYWNDRRMDQCFLQALRSLSSMLKQRHIGSFFYQDFNLIDKMTYNQAHTISDQIDRIVDMLVFDFTRLLGFVKLA